MTFLANALLTIVLVVILLSVGVGIFNTTLAVVIVHILGEVSVRITNYIDTILED